MCWRVASACSSSVGNWRWKRLLWWRNSWHEKRAGPNSRSSRRFTSTSVRSSDHLKRSDFAETERVCVSAGRIGKGGLLANYIGAIDQGTTSTRFIVFDHSGRIVSIAQKEHRQIYPQPGWVEHDAEEIWQRTREVIATAMLQAGLQPEDLAAIGISNQRETTVV